MITRIESPQKWKARMCCLFSIIFSWHILPYSELFLLCWNPSSEILSIYFPCTIIHEIHDWILSSLDYPSPDISKKSFICDNILKLNIIFYHISEYLRNIWVDYCLCTSFFSYIYDILMKFS